MPATTARTIITDALRRTTAIATGEAPSNAEAQDALQVLNDMLESWSLESLMVLSEQFTTHTLVVGQQTYTVGSGGDFDITWPLQIDQAQLRVTGTDPDLDLQISVLNDQEYGAIRLKQEQSTYVQAVWLHTTYPLATLYVWPIPTEVNDLVLWSKGVVAEFATLDTSVNLARGYRRAVVYNLTLELADEYGVQLRESFVGLAEQSKEVIKRANTKPVLAQVDVPAGMATLGGYRWLDDSGEAR